VPARGAHFGRGFRSVFVFDFFERSVRRSAPSRLARLMTGRRQSVFREGAIQRAGASIAARR